jgi:hypothetical protein
MIDLSASGLAVLSQNFGQHLQDLPPAHRPAFNQAADHAHMLDHWLIPLGRALLRLPGLRNLRRFRGRDQSALVIEGALLRPAIFRSVILNASPGRLLFAVGLPAAKGTAQVVAALGIAGMGQKENAALPAPGQAGSQSWLGSQYRSQQQIILQHQGGHRATAIPIHPELKMPLDPDCKKPKLSLRMLMKYRTSSSYRIGMNVSRKWDEDFCMPTPGNVSPRQTHYLERKTADSAAKRKINLTERKRSI